MAIQELARKQADEEAHIKRLEKLDGVLDNAGKLKARARRNSKDLEEQMSGLMDGDLEAAFHQFDTDNSNSLDEAELTAAFAAANVPIDEQALRKTMKLLDTDGDGVLNLDEFKQVALSMTQLKAQKERAPV